jgi:catechol 2,3-dioxygenase-like lactoylglutathione lyase family enzyme
LVSRRVGRLQGKPARSAAVSDAFNAAAKIIFLSVSRPKATSPDIARDPRGLVLSADSPISTGIQPTVFGGDGRRTISARPAGLRSNTVSLGEISNFDYAILLCTKIEETRAFYSDIMKFPIATDLENWVSFRVGATLLTLRRRGPWAVCDDGKSFPGSAAVQLAFRVSLPAVDACHAGLVASGVPVLREPTDLPNWRHRTLFFRDPEDNIIEIYAEY